MGKLRISSAACSHGNIQKDCARALEIDAEKQIIVKLQFNMEF